MNTMSTRQTPASNTADCLEEPSNVSANQVGVAWHMTFYHKRNENKSNGFIKRFLITYSVVVVVAIGQRN